MRLGTVADAGGRWRPVAFRDDGFVDLRAAARGGALAALLETAPDDPAWIASGRRDDLARLAEKADVTPLVGLTVGPPVPRPGKIIACGRNYMDHVREGQKLWAARGKMIERPKIPAAFPKFASAITHHDAAIVIPPGITDVDYEVELAVVIGTEARDVTVGEALRFVAGYTVANDVATRPIQFAEMEQQIGICMAKNLPTFAPLGPALVTADVISAPQALGIELSVNGETRQRANTADMIFSVAELVAYWSRLGLQVGDIILTGTPAGVAVGRPLEERARFFLHDGDIVEANIEGIGVLRNTVRG